jgi:hypothetical protein
LAAACYAGAWAGPMMTPSPCCLATRCIRASVRLLPGWPSQLAAPVSGQTPAATRRLTGSVEAAAAIGQRGCGSGERCEVEWRNISSSSFFRSRQRFQLIWYKGAGLLGPVRRPRKQASRRTDALTASLPEKYRIVQFFRRRRKV